MGVKKIMTRMRDSGYAFLDWSRRVMRGRGERQLMKSRTKGHVLTREQKREAKAFWSAYLKHPHVLAHEYYTEKNGVFRPEYIPSDIHYTRIDPYFNDWQSARALEHKCYFEMYFPGIKQPGTVAKRINGFWFGAEGQPLSEEEGWEAIAREPEVFAKIASNSCGGLGVSFLSTDEDKRKFRESAGKRKVDFIFQRRVRQHPQISGIYPNAINTIRVISMLCQDGVKILSIVIRMGRAHDRRQSHQRRIVLRGLRGQLPQALCV